MNIEEAKSNIGKEVVLDESTKPYTFISHLSGVIKKCSQPNDDQVFTIHNTEEIGNVLVRGTDAHRIHPRHIKLKEQPMNYKIRVTPETSAEVQELFFELGFEWANGKDIVYSEYMKILYVEDCQIFYRESLEPVDGEHKEITLPQLRDLVHGEEVDYTYHVGKDVIYKGEDACLATVDNNDFVGIFTQDNHFLKVKSSEISLKPKEYECYKIRVDETTKHEAINLLNKIRENRGFYKEAPKSEDDDTKLYLHNNSILSGKSGKPFDEEYFNKFDGKEVTLSELYNIAHSNKEMTWQDAEQAIKEGKDVQVFVCEWSDIGDVFKNHKFRLAPQSITLEARPYTKEELLKIAGEME